MSSCSLRSAEAGYRVLNFSKIKEIKGLRGGVLKYTSPEIPHIDPPEAEKRATYGWKLVNDHPLEQCIERLIGLPKDIIPQ